MNREYPYCIGKKENDRAEKIKDTAFTCSLIMSLLCSIAIIMIIFIFKQKISRVVVVGLLVIAVASFLQIFFSYYKELFRLEKKIKSVNIALFLFAGLNLLVSVLLVARLQLYALYLSLLLSFIVMIVYALTQTKHYFRLQIDLGVLRHLIKIAFPLLLVELSFIALSTADRLMIIKFLDVTQLGFYGLGVLVISAIFYIPIAIQFVTYPYLLERYGRTQEIKSLSQYLLPPTIFLSYLIPLLIGIILITIHLPIKYFLSSFLPGLGAIKILIAGTFFYSLVYLPSNFLIALKKHYKIIQIQSVLIIVNIILNYAFISMGMGIKGVALGTSISYVFLGTILLGYAVKHLLEGALPVLKFFTKLYLPFIYILGVFVCLNIFVVKDVATLGDDIQLTLLRLLIFIVFTSPLFFARRGRSLHLRIPLWQEAIL
ncbi:oligosaccharide flippase family protein [Candidatus Omnitrophota bacterium]